MLIPPARTSIVEPDNRFWVKGSQLLCGDAAQIQVALSFTFLPGGAVVVSDKANPNTVGARFKVLEAGSNCVLEGHSTEELSFEQALRESTCKDIFGFCWISQIKRVHQISLQDFLIYVSVTLASYSTYSLYFVSGWDVCNSFVSSQTSWYGTPPSPAPVAISPDGKLALCSNGDVLTLPELKLIRTTSAVPTYAHWIADAMYLVTEAVPQKFRIWDSDFNVIATTGAHGPDIIAAVFHVDSPLYATASSTRRVRVWDKGNQDLVSLKRFSKPIASLSFNQEGDCLEVQFEDGAHVGWNYREDNDRK